MPDAQPPIAGAPAGPIMYWRPGCGFCSALKRRLRSAGIPFTEVNIWSDEAAAAYVRSVARGNETVPTMQIGDTALVNPSLGQVLDAMQREGIPVPEAPARPNSSWRRLFRRR